MCGFQYTCMCMVQRGCYHTSDVFGVGFFTHLHTCMYVYCKCDASIDAVQVGLLICRECVLY